MMPWAREVSGAFPHRARRRSLLLWPLVIYLITGCATLVPKLEPPHVTVTGIDFGRGDFAHQSIRLRLHLANPNDRLIDVRGIECNVDLAGMPFAHGATAAAFTLPALGASDIELNVTADMNSALAALAGGLGHRALDYRLYGQVHLQNGLLRNFGFDERGRVRL